MNHDISHMRPSGAKGIFQTRVVANEPICREHRRLILEIDDFPEAGPGQFLQVRCSDPAEPLGTGPVLLRRPFSIGGLVRSGSACRIEILLRTVGTGTRWLGERTPGEPVEVLGPLGRPFEIDPDRPVAFLVGGGVGLPPLIWLGEILHQADKQTVAFCGARSADLLPLRLEPDFDRTAATPQPGVLEFDRWGIPTLVSTDDGSLGSRGRIPDHFTAYLDARPEHYGRSVVYTCGPEPMMRAVAEACDARGIPCQVSLERMMACGMGTCQSCAVPIRDASDPEGWSYKLCCTDGPVFRSQDIVWTQAEPPRAADKCR